MVTIRDIAKVAGVSPMTVSNVLNSSPHVRDSTRAKVLKTIEELDYRVNLAARNLSRGKTHLIGLAVPEVGRPFYGQFGSAVIERGRQHGFQIVIEQTQRPKEDELTALALSRRRMYDGLILSAVGLGRSDEDLLRVDFPVVILGERVFHDPVDHVSMPNVDGAFAAVTHLIDQGCRRIMAMHGPTTIASGVSALRHAGYLKALEAAGLEPDPSLTVVIEDFTPDHGVAAIHRAVADGVAFDGLFCVTDYVAMGAMRGLADCGLRVPDDVKVIGFDNVDSRFLVPSLSSIDPSHEVMATTAVDLLVARINGEENDPSEVVTPFTVLKRESTRM